MKGLPIYPRDLTEITARREKGEKIRWRSKTQKKRLYPFV